MKNISKILLGNLVAVLFTFSSPAQVVIDIDGNVYDTVHIGTQIWTRPNLKVTHYRNGDPIPNVTDSAQWYNLTTGAYCNYDNDSTNAVDYGRLYNWYAVSDPRNIAPVGWHVATFEDWDTLQIFLGYDLVAGGKLKEIGTAHWMSPNTGASDEYDFTALPGGQRADSIYGGTFTEITQQAYWWTSSTLDPLYSWGMNISYNSEGFTNWGASTRKSGFSVRLIKDTPVGLNQIDRNNSIRIYPNPADDKITIAGISDRKITMEIYNLVGDQIIQKELFGNSNIIDVSSLAPGLYVIKLFEDDWMVQRKLVVR